MKFSVCIPNYNYGRFLGRGIRSILEQNHRDLEVVVSDNASTDDSVAVARKTGDPRVQVRVNACNVGFAGNLDRTVRMATGDCIVLFPSDDLMRPGMLATYRALHERLGTDAAGALISATVDEIDPEDAVTGRLGPDRRLWTDADRRPGLDEVAGGPVYQVAADELLRRCLRSVTNPFNLTTTAYPRLLWERIEGYGGNRLINPDKWYHWRLLGVAGTALFVDRPLGASRWHPNNQTFLQAKSGALKYLVDEYVSTFEIEAQLLEKAGLTRAEFEGIFVEYDIARHGLATLAQGDRSKAARILTFGAAAYPQHMRRNPKAWALRALLAAGPLGRALAESAYKRYQATSPRFAPTKGA